MCVCVVLVSELVWEKFSITTGGLQPFPIHFPQYIKSEYTHTHRHTHTHMHTYSGEILTIMSLDCPEGEPLPFYRTFINHMWNVFQCVCRDLRELRHLVSILCLL